MLMKSASYNSGTSSHNSLTTETEFLNYAIFPHEFNRPAIATIILKDEDGTTSQKYDVGTNAVYVGSGQVQIWDGAGDATCMFDGRIVKARPNMEKNRVTLLAYDWSSQLGEERITYAMREDLNDGGGLRQSRVRADEDGARVAVSNTLYSAQAYDSGYTDETPEANDATPDDMTLMPLIPQDGDAYYFGFSSPVDFMILDITQTGAVACDVLWDYWDGDSWETLTRINGSASYWLFEAFSGPTLYEWTPAGDWAKTTVNGVEAYYIRSVVDGYNSITTQPLGGQVWTEYSMYDDKMKFHWSEDEFNDKYLVLTNENVGDYTLFTGPYDEITVNALIDTPTNGEEVVWEDDDDYHKLTKTASGTFYVDYDFKLDVHSSSLNSSQNIQSARIQLTYFYESVPFTSSPYINQVLIKDQASSSFTISCGKLEYESYGGKITTGTFKVPTNVLNSILSTDGEATVRLYVDCDGISTAELRVYQIQLEIDVVGLGTSDVYKIVDTVDENYVFDTTSAVSGAVSYDRDTATYTTETTEANNAAVDDMNLVDDFLYGTHGYPAYYFAKDATTYNSLKLNITTVDPEVVISDIIWQYSLGSGNWGNLLGVIDGTNDLTREGTNVVSWSVPDAWATDTINGVGPYYWIRAYVYVFGASGYPAPPMITGAQAWFIGTGSSYTTKLVVDRDLTERDVGVLNSMTYCIADLIQNHINTLVVGGDDLMTLTTNIDTTATGISTRNYDNRTRMEIINDLSEMDNAVTWIPLGTKEVQYKSLFNDGSPTAITDADVLQWTPCEYDYEPMRNEYHISGIRRGDTQLYLESEDLITDPGQDSKDKYGMNKTEVLTGTGVLSQYDLTSLATALVDRDSNVHLFLQATIAGISSLRLGDEVSISSTYLDLTSEVYVITHWAYDSANWRTTIRLQPRVSGGFARHLIFGEHVRDSMEQTRDTTLDIYAPSLPTDTYQSED